MTEYRIVRADSFGLRQRCVYLVDRHHSYIQWADRPSRKLYWLLQHNSRDVGVFGLGSAFDRNGLVKEYMARHNLQFNEVGNNIVYCLVPDLPRNAGSRFLAMCRRDAIQWWSERYGDTLKAFQTFILPPRTGAVYKADNWECIGQTTGNSFRMVTLYGDDPRKEKAEVRRFKSGEVKYLYREVDSTPPKLIFMRRAG